MNQELAEALDRLAIYMGTLSIPKEGGERVDVDRVQEAMDDPDFFGDWVKEPSDLEFTSEKDFHFSSPVKRSWPENNRVNGRLYACDENWRSKPTVLLLHGWNGELCYAYLLPYLAWHLNRAGINAAMIELPLHGRRKPPQKQGGYRRNFISSNLGEMVESTRQAIADVRATLHWFSAQGCPEVGLWGISLGAWICGLIAVTNQKLDFAVLMTPVVRMDRAIREAKFCEPIRQGLGGADIPLDQLNLFTHEPKLPPERLLLVAPQYDLLAPRDTLEELWGAWKSEIWRLKHGHISVLISPAILKKTVHWIVARTNGASRTG